jgi:Tfp pilus assembly protein PilF
MKRLAPALIAAACWASAIQAEPVQPRSDDEVVEVLPQVAGRGEERALRRAWVANPADARLAVPLARRYLDQARSLGDPRYAGRAMATLQAWSDAATAPDEVLLVRATVQQYLHEFDPAAATLEQLVARRPHNAQAWLTLATVRRVQGRIAPSDRACDGVAAAGSLLHAQACRAENLGLRGGFDAARAQLELLLATPRLPDASRNWLLTTLAELESRAARPDAADRAYRAALTAQAQAYTVLSYADFLMQQGRDAQALQQLAGQARTDAVLLRLAIAGRRSGAGSAPGDVAELRERMAQASLRPDARSTHAREQAMHALWIEAEPDRALALARVNVTLQREPLDLWLLAQAARATGRESDRREAQQTVKESGLHDKRLDALW